MSCHVIHTTSSLVLLCARGNFWLYLRMCTSQLDGFTIQRFGWLLRCKSRLFVCDMLKVFAVGMF
jgi:hypothetical protein